MRDFLTRRAFLRRGFEGGLGLWLARIAQAQPRQRVRAPFRIGLQSYSLRTQPYETMLKTAQELRVRYLEVYPGHLPLTEDEERIAGLRQQLKEMGLQIVAYGVVGFGGDAQANRRLFAFAKALGIEVLTADPDPQSFDSLAELVKEFGVKVAIHNHGPGHRYATREDLLRALEGRPAEIGVCLDTGHLVRAGSDVLETLRALKGRLHGVHLKDVNAQKQDVTLGTGTLDLAAVLGGVREAGLTGLLALEHELDPQAPVPGIRQALAALRKAMRGLRGA